MAPIFWAASYEAWRARTPGRPLAKAGVVAALAYVVDYHIMPRRLSPGFEHRISPPGMVCVYASFALWLALAEVARSWTRHRSGTPRLPSRTELDQPGQHAHRNGRQ
jgi:hypothetical protein